MAPASRQIRQLIREELSRALREGWDDEPAEEEDDRVVIDWREGPIDEEWVAYRMNLYNNIFDNDVSGFAQVADELVKMLEGEPTDPSIAKHYLNPDGTSKYTRASVEDLATKMLNILDDVAARQAEIDRRRALREGWDDEPEEEGTGYEYLSDMPSTVQWVDGPVDHRWLNNYLNRYKGASRAMRSMLARDFEKMLAGKDVDPDIVERYTNADGTSNVSRQTVEALVYALLSPDVIV